MSLQVWLPLNGNLNNQGLSDVTVTNSGATVSTSGKIGSCYLLNSAKLSLTPSFITSFYGDFSFSLWLKVNSFTTSYETYLQVGIGTTPWTSYRIGLLRNAETSNLTFCISDGSSSTQNNCYTSYSAGTWYHFTCTYSKTEQKMRIYKNGVLSSTYSTSIIPKFSDVSYITLGQINNGSYKTNCLMNDFRLYDHCLSAKEVKEISKGLLCHYKLNNKGFGNRNLVKGNFNCTSTSSTYNASGSLSCILTANDFISNKGKTLTLSCEIYSPGESKSSATDYRASRFGIHGSFNYTKTDGTKTQLYPFASLLGLGRAGKRYSESWTIPSDMTSVNSVLTFAIQTSSNSGFACPSNNNKETWWLKNVKLEWGSSPSAYSPANEDTLYTSLGLNSTTEEDCSGYSRNANKVNSPSFSLWSPRYEGGCKFTGSEYLTFPNPLTSSSTDFSISCWVKFDNLSDTMTVCTMRSSVGSGIALFKIGSNFRFDDNTQTTFSNYSILVNTWLHLVVTRTSSSKNLYINGNLAQSITTVGDMGGLHTTGSIGASSASGSGFGNFTKGVFSDFRIYATALSASDIKELYNTSASVDKNGNMYAYELKEE